MSLSTVWQDWADHQDETSPLLTHVELENVELGNLASRRSSEAFEDSKNI